MRGSERTQPISRPPPLPGAGSYVLLILDSCRFDSWQRARTPHLSRLGELQRRYSYATWTSPAHYNLLMGLLPHTNPQGVYASDYYRRDFLGFRERLRLPDLGFTNLLPSLWLPRYLQGIGYRTHFYASMPVLNPDTPLNVGFDTFELLDRHNDVAQVFGRLPFRRDAAEGRPSFIVINTGETHYPYATPDEPESAWPRLSGVNGVLRSLDETLRAGAIVPTEGWFHEAKMRELHARQVRAVEWVDRQVEQLCDLCPANTFITVTADHGELFGEGGFFGHGPIHHEKCVEVPFVEGQL